MIKSQLKNKANKTRKATDFSSYKKQRNYVVKLNNRCKKDHFDRLNSEKISKPFCKNCKPYFSNKHSTEESKIALVTIQVWRHRGRAERVTKINYKKWHSGEGVHANSDLTTKTNMYKFSFFPCFWSARQKPNFG